MQDGHHFAPGGARDWTEDLPLLARRGCEIGRVLCTCESGYHISWGARRAGGIIVGLEIDARKIGEILGPLLHNGTRILIAGAADTGSTCVVGRAAGGRLPEITVLDRCAAPLELIEQFAAERSLPVHTLHTDLLELGAANRWDVALVHYTLSFIAPGQRGEALRRLARALVPGGTLVCTTKSGRPPAADPDVLNSAWLREVRRKLKAARLELPLSDTELDDLLQKEAVQRTARRQTVPVLATLKQEFSEAGLSLTGEYASPRMWRWPYDTAGHADVEGTVVLTAFKAR